MTSHPTAKATRLTMADPSDLSQLKLAIEKGEIKPEEIVAVIGKTEGNGGVNDFTRGYFTQSLMLAISSYTGESPKALQRRIPCVLSGGTEGVLSPHYIVLTRGETFVAPSQSYASLAMGITLTRPLQSWEIGTETHWKLTAEAVRAAMAQAQLDASGVAFVQLKCPCFTVAAAQDAVAKGKTLCSNDPNRAMALSRVAGAWGVGLALGELNESSLHPDVMLGNYSLCSNRASVSSGVEVDAVEVIVMGNSQYWSGNYQIYSTTMKDALDFEAAVRLREKILLNPQKIHGVLVKCEPDRSGKIRGFRHTMLDDTDINAQRHIRGALGGLIASIFGDGRIFVSGGAEHQGPDGGGLLAIISER